MPSGIEKSGRASSSATTVTVREDLPNGANADIAPASPASNTFPPRRGSSSEITSCAEQKHSPTVFSSVSSFAFIFGTELTASRIIHLLREYFFQFFN